MPKSREGRLLLLLIAVVGIVLVSPFAVLIFLFSNSPPDLPVEERALQSAQGVLAALSDGTPSQITQYIATYEPECFSFLREHLEFYGNKYSLDVTAAIDLGSWDATVAVRFADGSEVELYFYQGGWESCYNLRRAENRSDGEPES